MFGKYHSDESKLKMKKNHPDSHGKNNSRYIDGRTLLKNFCIDCGKKITYKAKRCKKCKGILYRKYYFCIDCGKKVSTKNTKKCMKCDSIDKSKRMSGKNNPRWIEDRNSRKSFCIDCNKTLSKCAYYIGIKRCRSCTRKGNKHWNWIENRDILQYPDEFTSELKESIRKRDNYECQNCGMTEEEHLMVWGTNLNVHHIDYNKQNCKEHNLISLCLSCNARANFNIDYWKKIYKEKIQCKI